MLTIVVDETGDFENPQDQLKLIGGLAYVGDDVQELDKQLLSKLQQLCVKHKLKYPDQLHTNRIKNLNVRKQFLADVLALLKANGNFRLIGMLKSPNDLSRQIKFSNLVNEAIASNLYENMVTRFLHNLLFYNPIYEKEDKVDLKLATRVISVPVGGSATVKDRETFETYEKLGYSHRLSNSKNEEIFYLTDHKTFKSSLSTKILELNEPRSLECSFQVQSTNYIQGNSSALFYIADHICSYIRQELDEKRKDLGITKLIRHTQKQHGLDFLCFAYDDIDENWTKLYEAFTGKDYIQTLNWIFTLKNNPSPFVNLYTEQWVKPIELEVQSIFDRRKVPTYLAELEYLITNRNPSEQKHNLPKGIFIGSKLWERLEAESDAYTQRHKYMLADLMMRANNHKGDIEASQRFYDVCQELKHFVSPENFCATSLNAAQIAANEFDFTGAMDEVTACIPLLNKLKDAQLEIASVMGQENESAKYPLLGKFYSSIGQFHAFQLEYDKAYEAFEKALAEFDGPVDRAITSSYIVQMSLQKGDRELYNQFAPVIFQASTFDGQWQVAKKSHSGFELYAFLRAINVFELPIDEHVYAELEQVILHSTAQSHPWELIYKHAAKIFYQKGDTALAHKVIENMRGISNVNETLTIEVLKVASEIELLSLYEREKTKEIQHLYQQLQSLSKRNPSIKLHLAGVSNYEELCKKVTFTYA